MYKFSSVLMIIVGLTFSLYAGDSKLPKVLPRPDGKPADMKKPVQVYILMGQSNMLGFGKTSILADACKNKKLYPYLIDDSGNWTTRKDVRFVRVMCSGSGPSKTYNNEWMTIKGNIGPEMGIGHYVGHVTKAPVMILKSCIGNRSLGYDLLPPSAKGYAGNPDPKKRPTPGPWYAGVQYDGDIAAAKQVLANLSQHYPGAKKYEVAGFFWWQGDKDFRNAQHAADYEKNLLCLIKSLREDFNAPNARFVAATLGQTKKGSGGTQGQILEGTLNIDGEKGKYKAHKGKVASVYSHPLSKGGSSSGHYSGNAETYQNIGEAMGKAMAELILAGPGGALGSIDQDKLDSSLKRSVKLISDKKFADASKIIKPYLDPASGKDKAQVDLAKKLNDHLTSSVSEAIDSMDENKASGDLYLLKKDLTINDKGCTGFPAYDAKRQGWVDAVSTEKAAKEIALGQKVYSFIAKKEKAKVATYFAVMNKIKTEYPDSFYASKADKEIKAVEAELAKKIKEVNVLGAKRDFCAQYDKVKGLKSKYTKIPLFDEANKKWDAQFKDPKVRKEISYGKAYDKVFKDIDKLVEKYKKTEEKNAKITSDTKREKAVEKALASHMKKLKVFADKLEKMVEKLPDDSYYGTLAEKACDSFERSHGKEIKKP